MLKKEIICLFPKLIGLKFGVYKNNLYFNLYYNIMTTKYINSHVRDIKPLTTREILDNNWYRYWFETHTISSQGSHPVSHPVSLQRTHLGTHLANPDILNNAWHKNWLATKMAEKDME
jgi:hypothetical protein